MLYPSIWKCANNQIHTYLEIITNRDVDGEVKDDSSHFGHVNDTMAWRMNRVHKLVKAFNDGEEEDDDEDEESEEDFREKPCVFSVIRDPIKRVLSGYNEVEYRLITGTQLAANSQEMERPPYTKIPGYSLNHTGFRASQSILEKRFETFVRNLVQDILRFRNKITFTGTYIPCRRFCQLSIVSISFQNQTVAIIGFRQ